MIVLWSLDRAVLTFMVMPSLIATARPEKAGVSVSLNVREMALGAATIAFADGLDLTRVAWADAWVAQSRAVAAKPVAADRVLWANMDVFLELVMCHEREAPHCRALQGLSCPKSGASLSAQWR